MISKRNAGIILLCSERHVVNYKHLIYFYSYMKLLFKTILLNFKTYSHNENSMVLCNSEKKFLLHDAIEGQMTEVKGVGRSRTQLLDDMRNRRTYWELRKLKIEIYETTVYQSNIRKKFINPWTC